MNPGRKEELVEERRGAAEPGAAADHRADPAETVEVASLTEAPGTVIGRYKILEKIGEGGMAVVYVAEQHRPIRRRVALKIIKPGMDTKQVIARFEAEHQALALMDHPNIARVLDAGATEAGRPYFVMELVRGIPITQYCDHEKLRTRDRLDLFIQVCHAIQHAHQKGIIHRDIKPSNVMVTLQDGVPVPKVIDFGIAKATQQELTEKTVCTQFQQFIGTPAYMSPEQAEMSGLDIDTRSDIYSLGVLLYELLTGSTPFDTHELMQSGLDQMRKIICEREPYRPSTKVGTLSAEDRTTTALRQSTEVPKLISVLRGDLDWIAMKCLEKDRTRRYDTADALAMDLQRHIEHQPVMARSPSTAYRLRKAWRWNRLVYTAGLLVAVSLVVGVGVSLWQASVAVRARWEAQTNLEKAVAAEVQIQEALRVAEVERDKASASAEQLRWRTYVGDIGLAHLAIEKGDLGRARTLLLNHVPADGQGDLRGFEWRFLWSRSKGNHRKDLGPYRGFLSGVTLSPDGQLVALNRANPNRVEVIHLASGNVAKSIETQGEVVPLTYSETGRLLVGSHQGKVIGWNTQTWEPLPPLPITYPLAFGFLDGEEIFVALDEGQQHLTLWNAGQWRAVGTFTNAESSRSFPRLIRPSFGNTGHMMSALAIGASEGVVYLAGRDGLRRWDLRQRTELEPFPIPAMCVATSTDGSLAVAEVRGKIHFLNASSGEIEDTVDSHLGWITNLKFSNDGSRLVSASADRNVLVYDPISRTVSERLLGHMTEVWGLDISADGNTVVAGAGYGGKVLTWTLNGITGVPSALENHRLVDILDDGRTLLQSTVDSNLDFYDPISGEREPVHAEALTTAIHRESAYLQSVSPDMKWALAANGEALSLWNVYAGTRERTLLTSSVSGSTDRPDWRDTAARYSSFGGSFSPDGRYLSGIEWAIEDRRLVGAKLHLWRSDDWRAPPFFERDFKTINDLSFSVHSDRMAILQSRKLQVFDLEPSPREIPGLMAGFNLEMYSVALSPDGRWLAVGIQDNSIHIWDVGEQKEVTILRGPMEGVHRLTFSYDGRTLASFSGSSLILWNVATWQELFGAVELCRDLRFSPGDTYLVGPGGGRDSRSRLYFWTAPSWEDIAAPGEIDRLQAP